MKIVGRRCQTTTPMGERMMKAFYRCNGCKAMAALFNALQFVTILIFALSLQVNLSSAADTKIWEEFSGEKALAHVQRLVDLGPHPAGSEAIEKVRGYIEEQLRHSGWQVTS